MYTSIPENSKNADNLKETIKICNVEVLPNAEIEPGENVPHLHPSIKLKRILETHSCIESFNQSSVQVDGRTHSSSPHKCARLKVTNVCKAEGCNSHERKSHHETNIKTLTKAKSLQYLKKHRHNTGNVLHDNVNLKQTEPTSSVRQRSEKKILHFTKKSQSMTYMKEKIIPSDERKICQDDTTMPAPHQNEILNYQEHKNDQKRNSHKGYYNCKNKDCSCHKVNNSRSHKGKSESRTKEITSNHTCLGETHSRCLDVEESHALSKKKMIANLQIL